eukprot:3123223-Alexandrium_andersonii.AAC.1
MLSQVNQVAGANPCCNRRADCRRLPGPIVRQLSTQCRGVYQGASKTVELVPLHCATTLHCRHVGGAGWCTRVRQLGHHRARVEGGVQPPYV